MIGLPIGNVRDPAEANQGGEWQFDSVITDADPGAGKFRLNNATQGSATFIYISDTSRSGADVSAVLQALESGQFVYIGQSDDAARFHLFEVSGDPVDAVGYTKIPVTSADAGTDLVAAKECAFTFAWVAGGVFGSELQSFEDLADQSLTNGGGWIQATRFTTTSLPAGDYFVAWSADLGSQEDKAVAHRLQVDDTLTLFEANWRFKKGPLAINRPYFPGGGGCVVTLGAGTHDFDFDFQTGDTVYFRNIRLSIWRVA